MVPYRSHRLAGQQVHVLISQLCWATSTPEIFSTTSSVKRPRATQACGEWDTVGCDGSSGDITESISYWCPLEFTLFFVLGLTVLIDLIHFSIGHRLVCVCQSP